MVQKKNSQWTFVKPSLWTFITIILTIGALVVIWRVVPNWSGFGNKTLWDWLDLLIVPIVLATGALWFQRHEKERDREITHLREETELKLADEYRQDETLQNYFDKMTNLMLEKSLRSSKSSAEVRNIARVRTLTTLRGLNSSRKAILLLFLYESGLISANKPLLDMHGANLDQIELSETAFKREFSPPEKSGLVSVAELRGADLKHISLPKASLRRSDLKKTNLSGANLEEADFYKATLFWAELRNANLHRANLRGANLQEANFQGADLSETDMSDADISPEQLKQANSLFGAILPNGSQYNGKLNLSGDINLAISHGIDIEDARAMTNWYANGKT